MEEEPQLLELVPTDPNEVKFRDVQNRFYDALDLAKFPKLFELGQAKCALAEIYAVASSPEVKMYLAFCEGFLADDTRFNLALLYPVQEGVVVPAILLSDVQRNNQIIKKGIEELETLDEETKCRLKNSLDLVEQILTAKPDGKLSPLHWLKFLNTLIKKDIAEILSR